MNAATTTICQICQQPIERLTDRIYVNWGTEGMTLSQPNHKTCAQAQYARNQRIADGYVECADCGEWVLDLTANRLGGRCQPCSDREAEVAPTVPTVYGYLACGCAVTDAPVDFDASEVFCNACLKAMTGERVNQPEDDLDLDAWQANAAYYYRLMDERGY